MEDARDYSAGLLTLDGKRKERMWIPESKRLELNEIFPGEERKIGEKTMAILANGYAILRLKFETPC